MVLNNATGNSNVGIYVRESRDDNEENYDTIETQRDLLINFVNKNNFGEIVGIYMDNNASGAGFDRGGIFQLRKDIEGRKIDLLIIKDLSRLGRNNAKTLLFLDYLEENGVRVLTYDGRYDSVRDNETVGIETWFNERYIQDISKKIRASLRFKIEKGEYIGRAPFGYKKPGKGKNKLCIDEDTCHIIKEIFNLYLQGYGYSSISKILDNRGYPSPSMGKWNPVAVQRILSNRVYIGDTVQGVSEKVSYKSKKRRRLPGNEWKITEGTHEAIISKEEFNEVQRLRGSRRASHGPHKGTIHLFRGTLYCGRCGSTMYARKRTNRPMGYVCSNYSKHGRGVCTSHYINESLLESIIADEITCIFMNEAVIKKIKNYLDNTGARINDASKKRESVRKRLAVKLKQQEILYMDRLHRKISEELFLRINSNLENDIGYLKREIRRISNTNNEDFKAEKIIEYIIKDFKEKGLSQSIIKLVINRITVFDEYDKEVFKEAFNLSAEKHACDNWNGAVVIDFKGNKV